MYYFDKAARIAFKYQVKSQVYCTIFMLFSEPKLPGAPGVVRGPTQQEANRVDGGR